MASSKHRPLLQRKLIMMLCNIFVLSWHGVVKFHGVRPPRRPNQIYVANHTTMADVIVMMMQQAYSIVGQAHPGWLGARQRDSERRRGDGADVRAARRLCAEAGAGLSGLSVV
jgi:hypothetical protein